MLGLCFHAVSRLGSCQAKWGGRGQTGAEGDSSDGKFRTNSHTALLGFVRRAARIMLSGCLRGTQPSSTNRLRYEQPTTAGHESRTGDVA